MTCNACAETNALMITELINDLKTKQRNMETNNSNINNSNELEQMRAQLEIMKQKLSRQKIVNDNLISKAMSNRMSWIKKFVWIEILVLIPLIAIIYAMFHISLWLYAVILTACIVDAFFDYRINKMNPSDWLAGNLVETGRKLVRMKRQRKISFFISVAATIVIFGYFCYEMSAFAGSVIKYSGVIGCIIGGICGLSAAYIIYRKMQRTNDELIHQIEEMNSGRD